MLKQIIITQLLQCLNVQNDISGLKVALTAMQETNPF